MSRILGTLVVVLFSLQAMAQNAWTTLPDPAAEPAAKWMWGPSEATPGEVVCFRATFDAAIPTTTMTENPSSALLWCSSDDDAAFYVNGKKVAESTTGTTAMADVRAELKPGKNVIAVHCKNKTGPAGIIAKLEVRGQYRSTFTLVTDSSWKCFEGEAPKNFKAKNFNEMNFVSARIVGNYGMQPWGKLPPPAPPTQATAADTLTLPPGFKAELLYSVPKAEQGSWVSMAHDDRGRLYCSDQGGPIYRVDTTVRPVQVEPIPAEIGSAQGLLWYHNSLYVMINGTDHGHPSGIYRVTSSKNDDRLDHIEQLLLIRDRSDSGPAGGEHGPHAIVPGPDGKLYFVAGNFTNLPKERIATSPAAHWGEDLLLTREPDGRGHDPGIMAPGGWICRMDPDGKNIEAFATGMRNTYDFAFNPDGELISFDSDMEWDIGAPWYRPIRFCHVTSGSEWGWRNGSGKWPTYYPDSLPPIVNVGLGSPTGLVYGTKAKFPAKYQHALFANDWAYGKILALWIKPDGSSYSGEFEPFITGKPFDVTDMEVGADGALYVEIGGRSTQSGLYRISYVGNESTAPAPWPKDRKAEKAREIRHELEAFHGHVDSRAINKAFDYLDSDDRFIRYAARVALEFQPASQWQERALRQSNPTAVITGMLGLCRVGDKSLQSRILKKLDDLEFYSLSRTQKLELLRTYGVCFIRMGKPTTEVLAKYAHKFDAYFPCSDEDLNHELAQLLVYCDSPNIVSKSMELLSQGKTQEEQMFYAFILRYVNHGWTLWQRYAYFSWFNMAEKNYSGGASFVPFLQHIRDEAINTLNSEELNALSGIIKAPANMVPVSIAPVKERKFVKHWQMEDLLPKISQVSHGRSFKDGKAVFDSLACIKCHRFAAPGESNIGTGSVGPDITGVGQRFSAADILESIILPSKVISDQYRDTVFRLRSGLSVVGMVQSEDAERIVVRTSPLSPTTETVMKKDIVEKKPSKISAMPTGLIDNLNETEILDLLAYLRSGGKSADKAFKH